MEQDDFIYKLYLYVIEEKEGLSQTPIIKKNELKITKEMKLEIPLGHREEF